MSQPYALFHRENFPLVVIEFTGEKATPENFKVYLRELEENYQDQEKIALVFDARSALELNPIYQGKQAAWMQKKRKLIKTYCQGIAYVVPQPFLRKVLQLIFKMSPNPVPFQVFESLDQGLAWAEEQLAPQE